MRTCWTLHLAGDYDCSAPMLFFTCLPPAVTWRLAAGAQKKQQELYGDLAECSFAPRTGRGPASGSRAAAANLPAPVRLYANHGSKYKQVRLAAQSMQSLLLPCDRANVIWTTASQSCRCRASQCSACSTCTCATPGRINHLLGRAVEDQAFSSLSTSSSMRSAQHSLEVCSAVGPPEG